MEGYSFHTSNSSVLLGCILWFIFSFMLLAGRLEVLQLSDAAFSCTYIQLFYVRSLYLSYSTNVGIGGGTNPRHQGLDYFTWAFVLSNSLVS
jgi:hypothetical protein